MKLFSLIPGRDLIFKETTGSGPGGQHRNRTKSTILLTHPESGVSVKAGDEKSQHRNKRIALKRLAENREFRSWVRLQAAIIAEGYHSLEEKVNKLMDRKALKIEYIHSFMCDGCKKKEKMISDNQLDRKLPPGWKETARGIRCRKCST